MNAIIGFSDLMNEAEPEDKNTYAQIISNSGNQLLALIDDVILLSRLQSEKMPLNKVEFKPAELVKEVSLMFGHPDMNKGLDILVNIPKPYKDLNIWADADKIRQILTNLTANAVKYTQTGNIEIGFLMHKEHIEFYTKDTGIGLSEQDATRIFEAFYRSDRALSLAIRGTGLGLNIAKALTEQIGGTINVYSIQDKGSCFYFVIPLEICEKPATHLDEPLNLHKETKDLVVLIAEDEPINFQYLSALLKGNVSRIDHAENGKEAVELASRNIYDLVLMDIKMPVMGGIEATKLLKKRYPDLLIIAQTAYTLPEEKESALDAGCVDFISKPISKAILMEMIHKYC
jgi:CheY-like chemotaxis protein